jgi:3-phosphoshikimate 1-carboxyvinyltransferase
MTLDTLEKFGIRIGRQNGSYTVKGNQKYEPRDVKVEGDWSQAAFFIAAAALSGGVTIDGLRGDSLQPDSAIIEIMKRMGARIEQSENAVRVEKSALHGIEVDVSQCPDLVPPIAAAAAYA